MPGAAQAPPEAAASRWDLRSEVPIARGLAPTRAFPHRDLRTRPKPKRKVPVSQHRRSLRGEKSATAFGAARPSGTKPAASSDPRSRRRPVPRHPPPALPAARRIPRPGGPGRAPPPPPASPPPPARPGSDSPQSRRQLQRAHRRAAAMAAAGAGLPSAAEVPAPPRHGTGRCCPRRPGSGAAPKPFRLTPTGRGGAGRGGVRAPV